MIFDVFQTDLWHCLGTFLCDKFESILHISDEKVHEVFLCLFLELLGLGGHPCLDIGNPLQLLRV